MYCNDCGNKINSWQEYCNRCGAALYKRLRRDVTRKHSVFSRLLGTDRLE